MSSIEKVSIALPSDMLAMVKQAVEGGDYASSSEVVREALREWKARRAASGAKTAETPRPTDRALGLTLINERSEERRVGKEGRCGWSRDDAENDDDGIGVSN